MTDLDAKEAELRRLNEELDREYLSSSKSKRKNLPQQVEETKHEEAPPLVQNQEEKLEVEVEEQPHEQMDNEFEANLHQVQRYQEVAERNKELAKIVRIQKAKIQSLESELDKTISATNSKDLQITELKTNNAQQTKELKEQNIKITSMSKTIEKLKKSKEELDKRLMDLQRHNEELRKDVQKGVDERKRGDQLYNNKEVKQGDVTARLNRLQDELEKTKILLKEAKNADSSKTDQLRKDIERMHEENRRIERQKNEILLAFKKQFKLIDILKRQKIHIEAARLLNFTEDEFIKTLEVGDKL